MAVDRVKCATLSSATSSSSNSTNSSTNRTSCLRLDCGVMTNVCSPSLAHDAQSQSPTRPESSSPSLDTSADAGAAITSPRSPAPISLNTNSSAMQQQLNKTNDIHSSSADQMDIDGVAGQSNLPTSPIEQQPAMSPNHSPINGSRPEDEQRPKTADADPKPDAVADQEPVSRPSSRDSRTSTNAAASPSSLNHNEASNHSPQPDRDSDRKELEEMLTEKNSKIKQLEDQLAKQRDYEQIKHELNLLKEQISLLRNEKPLDLLLALDKSRSMQTENAALNVTSNNTSRSNNNSPPKPLLPNIQNMNNMNMNNMNMNMFASLLGEEVVRDSFLRTPRPDTRLSKSATVTDGNLLFGVDSVNSLLESAPQRISPALRRPQSADNLKANMNSSNSNQSMSSSLAAQPNLASLPAEAFAALDNEVMMAKNNPSISQLTTSISSSLLASTNSNQYQPSSTPNPPSAAASSSLQIPQLDPMLTVTTPAAQVSLTKLTEKLRHNVDRYMNQNLNTQNISRCVRELLSVHNIGQRLFAKYVLGLSQGTVSELLSKPKQWDKLTEKGRDSYRKMHAWASDEDCIYWLKFLVPKKGKEVYNASMISSTMTNTASMITGTINNGNNNNSGAIQNLAGALANGSSSNSYNPMAGALNKDDSGDRLQALLKAQSLFSNANNGLNQSNSSSSNPMLELMAASANNLPQQQLMDLLLKSHSSANQNGIQQQNLEGDCSQMSDDLDSKDRSMTPLDSFCKKLTNGAANQNDSMQEAMARIYQEQVTKLIAAQMEENIRQQQQSNNVSNNHSSNDKADEIRQAIAIYHQELAKLTSGGQPSIESLSRLQNAAYVMNQASANQERLLLREGNLSRDSNSSLNDESKGHNPHLSLNHLNHSNNSNQQSNSAFPMVKNFLNSSNNGSGSSNTMIKHEDSNSSGKSTPVNNSLNNGSVSGQPEDLSLVNSPLQRIQSITNSLLQHPHSSTSPNRSFIQNNNAAAAASKQILPPITQHQFDIYNNLNTEEIVKRVKEQLSQYSISQRLFGESVLGLSQGSVSDLLARPKPWHMLTQKGREPFIRMRMFLEDENAVHKLVASQYKIAPDKLMRTGSYASTGTNGSQIPSALSSDLSQLSNLTGLAALGGQLPGSALNALTAMDNGSIAAAAALNENASNNPAFAAALLLASNNGNRLNLEALKLLERHQAGSPINISNSSQNFHLNNSLMDSSNTQRSSANSTPERRSPSLNNSASSPNSQANLFLNHKRPTSTGPLSLNGLPSSEFSSQSISSKMGYNQPQSVYEMAALTDTLDTQDVTTKIKESLMQHNIGQKIFGEVVLGLSQGSVSELLSKPKPWAMLSIKGREPFIRMKMWLNDPNNVEKLQSLKNERREANKRRRNADTDPVTGFPMDKLMSGSLENGSNDLYGPNALNSFSPSNTTNLNNLLLANFNSGALNNSNQFNMSGNMGPQSKKPRILFSDEQKEALKIAFQMDSYPTTSTIEQLSNELQLSVRTITNWFHNHRMRLKQANSSNNASSPDENSSNYSFSSNGRETSNSTFDLQKFRTLLDQRINELKLNPANTTQSTIKLPKENRLSQAFNLCNPQLMELIRNGGDLSSISSLMNSLTNNTCVSPSSSNQEEYSYQEDDLDDEEAGDHNDSSAFQTSMDLSLANGNLKQQLSRQNNLVQRLQRRNNSEDECNYSENDDEEMQTGDLDEHSDDFEHNSLVQEKRSKLMPRSENHNTGTSKKRKSAQPQYVHPKDNSLEESDKHLNDKKLAEQDDETSMHSIEAQ